MASSSNPVVDRIRIIPRPNDFLDRNVGSSGEVFFNKATNSLRVYSGNDRSGFEIARADLNNVTITNDDISWIPYENLENLPDASNNHGMFAHVHSTGKAYYAHAGNWIELANANDLGQAGGGASVDVSNEIPSEPQSGNLWLNTNTGKLYIYIDDGDSSQWIQPNTSVFSGSYNDLIDVPVMFSGSYNDLTDKPTFTETGFDGSYSSLTNKPTSFANLTSLSLTTGATINEFSTDGSLADASDTAIPTEAAVKTYVDGNRTLPDLNVDGLLTLRTTTERYGQITAATGTVDHDFSSTAVFYHLNIGSNFTANFTNIPVQDLRTISVALILSQGLTPYMPTALEIDGVAQTIRWQGGVAPTGTTSGVDVISFTLIKVGVNWTVIGSGTSYS